MTEPDVNQIDNLAAIIALIRAAADTATERAVMARYYGDADDAPRGAPFKDPCPGGARQVRYDVALMQCLVDERH